MKVAFGILNLVIAMTLRGEDLTTLHTFEASGDVSPYDNVGGANPKSELLLSNNVLYGVTPSGGSFGNGTVFRINSDGTGFTNLHSFAAQVSALGPEGALVLSNGRLYGTTYGGGASSNGTVFAVNVDGTDFTTLHDFSALSGLSAKNQTNSDGAFPPAGLVVSGDSLYGTASGGGMWGNGTIFKLNTDGTGFTILHTFTALTNSFLSYNHNYDGADPAAGLVLSGNTLYGTTTSGGSQGHGTIFKVNTDGSGFTRVYSSTTARFYCTLVLSGDKLYGTTKDGGTSGQGTVFVISTNGTGLTNLHVFSPPSTMFSETNPVSYTNSDGVEPLGTVLLCGNTLYGTTDAGGFFGLGTVFGVNTDGTGFGVLHHFRGGSDEGANPESGLVGAGRTLFGTTIFGGQGGTIFSLSLATAIGQELTISTDGTNAIVVWPTNGVGLNLQSAQSPAGPFTNISGATSPYTNSITSFPQFFRLTSD